MIILHPVVGTLCSFLTFDTISIEVHYIGYLVVFREGNK